MIICEQVMMTWLSDSAEVKVLPVVTLGGIFKELLVHTAISCRACCCIAHGLHTSFGSSCAVALS